MKSFITLSLSVFLSCGIQCADNTITRGDLPNSFGRFAKASLCEIEERYNHNASSLSLRNERINLLDLVNLFENKPIQDLRLENCTIVGDIGILGRMVHLNRLFFEGSNIGDNGAIAIAQNTRVTWINLSGNNIGDAGAQALASVGNRNITNLRLDDNNIGDAGAMALSGSNNIRELYLLKNDIRTTQTAESLIANMNFVEVIFRVNIYNTKGQNTKLVNNLRKKYGRKL